MYQSHSRVSSHRVTSHMGFSSRLEEPYVGDVAIDFLVMVSKCFGNRDLFASDLSILPILHIPDNLEHELHLLTGKDEPFLRQVSHLLLCQGAHISVHPTYPWVGGGRLLPRLRQMQWSAQSHGCGISFLQRS